MRKAFLEKYVWYEEVEMMSKIKQETVGRVI